jgi:hypothetical protein
MRTPDRPVLVPVGAFACFMITPIVLLVFLAHAAKPRHIKPETFSTKQAEPGHHGRVPEVDDDQLAALHRLRAAFGFVQIIEVISHDPVVSNDLEPAPVGGVEQGRHEP